MNVIQQLLKESRQLPDTFLETFANLIKEPAKNLVINYLSQVNFSFQAIQFKKFTKFFSFLQSLFTFFYLYSLFRLAEQTASRIRIELFGKFLSFELEYFDLTNGGNILSVISNDVQEFKSSFKQIISLGIKNVAQVLNFLFFLCIVW